MRVNNSPKKPGYATYGELAMFGCYEICSQCGDYEKPSRSTEKICNICDRWCTECSDNAIKNMVMEDVWAGEDLICCVCIHKVMNRVNERLDIPSELMLILFEYLDVDSLLFLWAELEQLMI